MSAAARIREAARVLTERAEAATPGPWRWEGASTSDWPQGEESLIADRDNGEHELVLYGWGYDASGIDARDEDRAYIALMSPGVGLVLADLLNLRADYHDAYGCTEYDDDGGCPCMDLADQILGEQR